LFEFVKTTNLALDELAKKDKKYKPILTQLKNILSETKGEFLVFDKAHTKVEQTTNQAHLVVKDQFNQKIKAFNLNLNVFSKDIDLQIQQVEQLFLKETEKLTKETADWIHNIHISIKEIEQKFNDSKSKSLAIRSKEISDITKVMQQIKKNSVLSIEKLENNYKQELDQMLASFNENESKLLESIHAATTKYEQDKAQINQVKNYYREQSDKKYLSIKSDYHTASTEFNKSLDKLKKEKDTAVKKIKHLDDQNRLPIEDALHHLKISNQEEKQSIETLFSQKLAEHKTFIESLTITFNESKERLIIQHGDAVSLINSKLSSYVDSITTDRQDRNNQLTIDIQNAIDDEAIKSLKRVHQKHLRQQENELNRQIQRNEKLTLTLLKEHYTNLQALEFKFLEDKSKWRIDGKRLVVNQKLSIFNHEQNYQYQLKSLELQLKTLRTTNEFELERMDIQHLSKIAPLELKLSIANSISEKDVNLLSNDTNYHLNHYQHQEDILTHDYTVFKLLKEHELEILKIRKEHDMNVLNMKLQLSIDKENVIREQQLSNQQLKKEYSELSYGKLVSNEELIYLRQKSLYEIEIEHLKKLERSQVHYLSDKRIIEQNLLQHKRTIEDTNIHYLERTESVQMSNEMMTKDLEVIHSRIHYLFNQIYLIYNIHHHFMLSLIQIYEIPAHPEDVKQYIHLYLDVFTHLNTLQEHAKDQFLVDLNAFQELKINDLSALKLKTDINLLESEYHTKIKNLDQEIESNQQQINQIEERIVVLSTNVDQIQFELNGIDDTLEPKVKTFTRKQLEKQLNAIESDISFHDKSIMGYNKIIENLTKRKNKLTDELNHKHNIITQKNTNETAEYLKQKSFYVGSVKQITSLFKSYEDKVQLLTKKIDQPIYLTDNIIKEYQKGYLKVEDYFEKSSNQLYQSLLKGSVQLFDQLIKQQNTSKTDFLSEQKTLIKKLDRQQASLEDKLKEINNDYKHQLSLLDTEKDTMIKNINTVQFKGSELNISNILKQIQSTEEKIMTTESNLKKEMVLIDDNLKSVVEQMQSDFEKHIQKLVGVHEKQVAKLKESLEMKAKNLKALEESTELKNSQLSQRFTQTELKLMDANKTKINGFEQSIQKKQALLSKKTQALSDELRQAQDRKDQMIAKNDKKMLQFVSKIESFEKQLLVKELQDAKKSYLFKQRTLKF